ncbi:HAMP domain-containing sensor histidine kinase [Bacillus haynesii]|uniref:sensor histidine kinase n=1 Tax=Bacillus TaxID=1386 RepID=UPI002280D48D|nr:HAMP domain-containing sensor histidine kinase [Bacillus haynesii]MCY7800368.1 HAMP domain-containing histidine kinase [Bacillus haynesii]
MLKEHKKRLTIKKWLFLFIIAFILLPILTTKMAVHFYNESKTNSIEIEDIMPWLEQNILNQPENWNKKEWQKQIHHKTDELHIGIRLLNKDQKVLFSTIEKPDNHQITKIEQTADYSVGNTNYLLEEYYVYQNKKLAGILYVQDKRPALHAFNGSENSFLEQYGGLFIALFVFLMLLATAAWFMNKQVLIPLTALEKTSQLISKQDFNFSLPSSRVTEIHEVSNGFKSMQLQLKKSLAKQQSLENERKLFIASIVHDLRTPIFTIRGYLEIIEKQLHQAPEKVKKYIVTCRNKADMLNHLVSDLFSYTKLELYKEKPSVEFVNLNRLLDDYLNDYSAILEEKGIHLIKSIPEGDTYVYADPELFSRAFYNIIDNAIRFSFKNSDIYVSLFEEKKYAVIAIRDKGKGLHESELDQIFTPLYRGETSRNRKTGGAGLGLAISKEILEVHGGKITAENHNKQGAVFKLYLPLPNGL